VLTTNRLDVLEPALAARPGRIDHAVEIGLPDAAARRRLLDLYLGEIEHTVDAAADIAVQRTEGMTASFVRELVRRSVLDALDKTDAAAVTDANVVAALDEMLESVGGVRAVLFGGAQMGHPMPSMPPGFPPDGMPPGMVPPPFS